MPSELYQLPVRLNVKGLRRLAGRCFEKVVWTIDKLFDLKFGTDTSGIIELKNLDISSDNVRRGTHYEATPNRLVKKCLSCLQVHHQDFTFIDLGSGKGRTLLLAARYPFKRIVGVEFSESLHETAQRNIAAFAKRSHVKASIQTICTDASDFAFPSGNLVIYIANPFDEVVLTQVVGNLKKSIQYGHSKIIIIYVEAHHDQVLDESGLFQAKQPVMVPKFIARRPTAFTRVFIYASDPELVRCA